MMYSIAILDICNVEAIGRKIPKGTGVDATKTKEAQGFWQKKIE
jgi:hypothetical protein